MEVLERISAAHPSPGLARVSKEQQAERVRMAASSPGSIRAEGLEPTDEGNAYVRPWIQGEISADEAADKLLER